MFNDNIAVKKSGMRKMKRQRLLFYSLGLVIPAIQFALLFVYVNIDSVLLCFQGYEMFGENAGRYTWVGINNFVQVFETFQHKPELIAGIGRSCLIYLFNLAQMPIHILAAWYVVKKKPFSTAAHVILYIPGVLSAMVSAAISKYFLCESVPAIVKLFTGKTIPSLLDSGNHMQTFWVVLINSAIGGVTGNLLIYAGSMNSVSESILEAAELDGITPFKEFWYIYLPELFPTIAVVFIMGVDGVVTSDIGLFTYFGEGAPKELHTIGYYLTVETKNSDFTSYPYLSAFNMSLCFITVPLTIACKKMCDNVTRSFN